MHEFTRRGCLTGLAVLAGLSGCMDSLDGGGESGDGDDDEDDGTPDGDEESPGPEAVVRTYYRALDQGAFEAASERLHSETLEPSVTRDRYGNLAENDFGVESTEVLERTETRAIVRVNVSYSTGGASERITDSVKVELRPEDDEWRVYASGPRVQSEETPTEEQTPERAEPTPDGAPVTGDPRTAVRGFYEALDEGDRAAANARLHSQAQGVEVTERAAESLEEASLSVESVTLLDRSGDTAIVVAEIALATARSDGEQTNRVRIELYPEDGQWKIYSASQAG